jgi:2,2-dialkylglycine decarboxylase (pyruvate)
MGTYLRRGLEELQGRYEILGDVRGIGLMQGIEIVKDKDSREPSAAMANAISARCVEHGLILFGGSGGNVIRITPPLMLTKDEAGRALDIIEDAIGAVSEGAV